MSFPLYHCVRGIELGVPGAIKSIGPLQTQALTDVTYMPWLNLGHCVEELGVTPLIPDPESMRNYITNVVLDEDGYPICDFMYLDIEGVLHPDRWFLGQHDLVRDCIGIAKSVLHWRGQHRCRVFVWDSLQGPFKRGRHPDYTAHASVDPHCDAHYLSMYGFHGGDGNWRTALKLDMDWAHRYSDFYGLSYSHGRPRVFFVWGWHGKRGFYPHDMWQAWIEFLMTLARPGDVFCWFGAAHSHNPALDTHYGPQIEMLKNLVDGHV